MNRDPSSAVCGRQRPARRALVWTAICHRVPSSRPSGRAAGGAVDERLDRRRVAVMFTDMVGYTALMQADERRGLDTRDLYMTVLESEHDAFGGTIVQRLGDGSMSMFPSSLAAVQAGVAIQRELGARDVPVRIGIHVGEVIVEPERLTGDAVNIAARNRVLRGGRRSDVVRHRVRADREPGRRRRRRPGTVQAQERRAPIRALRGNRRGHCRAGPGGARGQGRAVRQPA